MATIKEVARLAGVSIGTVSNVLNGKTHNEDLIEKVENAVNELSYRPDTIARSLKNTHVNLIGVVIPDVVQPQYHEFLMTLEKHFRSQEYNLVVRFSRNNSMVEKQSIEALLDMRVSAIIIYTSAAQNFKDEWIGNQTPMLLISNQSRVNFHGDSISLDYREAFQKTLNLLLLNKKKHIGMVVEKDLYEKGGLKEIYQEYFHQDSLVILAESLKEAGFKAAFEFCSEKQAIDAIIAGSHALGEGLMQGLDLLNRKDITVYAIKASSWIEDAYKYSGEISLSQHDVAMEAVHDILNAINRPMIHEQISRSIFAELRNNFSAFKGITPGQRELRFAMYDCSSARSLQMYSMIYEREYGQKIHFDMFSYAELESMLYDLADRKDTRYDGFMIDIAWFQGLVESGYVKNLDHILKYRKDYLSGFVANAVKDYGMYVESLFALPFMSGSQILYYQRDLFDNTILRRKFQRKYNAPLAPPTTWVQFNAIAEFFTREYTPDSPVKYGVSIAYGDNVYMTIDFLDRLWSYGGKIFDDFGNVSINSNNALTALRSLMLTYSFSSGKVLDSWDKVATEFESGASAMAVLYNSDVGDINDPTKSKVAGNLGYSIIPGRTPVQGGWSLALNRYSSNAEEAEKFLLWACDKSNCIPLTLMGGSTLRQEYYQSQDTEKVQPWKNLVEETFHISRKRAMPEILDDSRLKNRIYTDIIPNEILRVYRREISDRTALENMEQRILELIRA